MKLGEIARNRLHILPLIAAFLALLAVPQASFAATATQAAESSATAPAVDARAPNVADETATPAAAAEGSTTEAAPAATPGYTPLDPRGTIDGKPTIKGAPTPGGLNFQKQYSEDGRWALWMHDAFLLPMMVIVSLLVLFLLLWVVAKYNRKSNPVPSKTSHNTLIEVLWTVVPVLILVVIAIPSITLLARQYKSPPEDALTIKATGYQWYWGYTYADNGGFEVISNMMDEGEAARRGEPPQLAADNRMVVPVGETLRIQVTGADVIHAFGVPSLWFKIDAVPGRINERTLKIDEPGIYYGQCMELCGARHGYMPIVIEAVPRPQFEAWIRSKGGTLPGDAAATPVAAPAAATPQQEPESSVEGAPGAGAAPTDETAPGTPVPAA